jgi:hypothetical protein
VILAGDGPDVNDKDRQCAQQEGHPLLGAAAVEECQLAERVQVREAEHVAIPGFRAREVLHGARNLTDRSELEGPHRSAT